MRSCDEDLAPTPDERRRELAALLASGVLRLQARAALSVGTSLPGLEVLGETVLSVPVGLRSPRHQGAQA